MSTVEYQVNAEYGSTKTVKPIIGHWSTSNKFIYDDVNEQFLPLYNLVSRYYRNAEIGYDTVDEFLIRFNDKWNNAVYKIKTLLSETGDFQIGSMFNIVSHTDDKNTILHGHTDTYQRTGNNKTTSQSSSSAQNSVTQLEKGNSSGASTTEYGEGYTNSREMNGKADTRETDNTRKTQDIEAEDIRHYLEKNYGQLFIQEFHDLFMEVYD